jgi:hypothetical protein
MISEPHQNFDFAGKERLSVMTILSLDCPPVASDICARMAIVLEFPNNGNKLTQRQLNSETPRTTTSQGEEINGD